MTTARSRAAPRPAIASGVDLAAAIDAFLSQPDLAFGYLTPTSMQVSVRGLAGGTA